MEEQDIKVVVRGLPWETRAEDVAAFLGIQEDQLNLPVWNDSGRCKGVGFITCVDEAQAKEIKSKDGEEFEAEGNNRTLSIRDYEERPRRAARGRGRGRGRGRRGRGRGDESAVQTYEEDDETSREVYVSNVPFKADKSDFERIFGIHGTIEEINIPTVYTSGKPKGFAFVRFATTEGRDKAVENLNETIMLERTIGVRQNKGRVRRPQRTKPQRDPDKLSSKPSGCCTIYVGNLPFETDEDELKELFAGCGEIRNTRIVRQYWSQKSRGFGYVEFEEEAAVDTAVQKQITVKGRMGERKLRLDYAENLQSN